MQRHGKRERKRAREERGLGVEVGWDKCLCQLRLEYE